ncbi:MAG: hypothetical protein FJW69_09655 [Actinobacteria bacterium]|nr:hypothetical protein [Actinomycetota bacterium]
MSVAAILEGIQERYDSQPVAKLLSGMWLGLAPDTAGLPYAVYTLSLTAERTFGERFENGDLTIRIYYADTTAEDQSIIGALDTIGEAMASAFDDCSLTLTGYTSIYVTRRGRSIARDPDGGWTYELQYDLQVQED